MYPPLPTVQARAADETAVDYGARVLAFLLAEAVTATVDDEALEAANHAAMYAVAARGILPAAVDRIAEVRRTILATLARRAAARTREAEARRASAGDRPPPRGGQRAKLVPVRPRRPSPAAVVNPF
jgi:hypothetical protein